MNDTRADEKALIGLDELSLSYNYQFSRSITEQRLQYSKIYDNENYYNKTFKPFELVSFDYNRIKFNMITCPTGMGINIENWGSQEIKEPFMLGETEVTQELFEAVMGFNHSNFKDSNKNPVERVTWYDCLEFCNRLSDYFGLDHCYILRDKSYRHRGTSIHEANIEIVTGANGFRLPTEWEWQIAAMTGKNNKYAGANDDESLKRVAWFYANSGRKTHPVAQKLPNEWGFYDMSGNVDEWCENSTQANENNNPSVNRISLGGGWSNFAKGVSLASRHDYPPTYSDNTQGFRVARSI